MQEAIDALRGEGPKDLEELCLALGRQMVYLAQKADSLEDAEEMLREVIRNGKALEKFKEFIQNQGGDPSVVDHPDRLPKAQYLIELPAQQDGVVAELVADEIGTAPMCWSRPRDEGIRD